MRRGIAALIEYLIIELPRNRPQSLERLQSAGDARRGRGHPFALTFLNSWYDHDESHTGRGVVAARRGVAIGEVFLAREEEEVEGNEADTHP